MIFQKNRFLANTGIIASTLISVILGFLILLHFYVDNPDPSLSFFITFFSLLALLDLVGTVILVLDNKSTLIVSESGVEMKSRIRKPRYIRWEDCGFIGIYGYYYGMQGILVFSTERYICYSLKDCRRFANKNRRSVITVGYTPELFAAVEKHAPAHLVNGCRSLFSHKGK